MRIIGRSDLNGVNSTEGGICIAFPPYEVRDEYDFSTGVRGKHYQAYSEGTNVVFSDPDVARAFPNDAAVNKALRYLLEIAETSNSLRVHVKL